MDEKLRNFSEFEFDAIFMNQLIDKMIQFGSKGICCKSKRVSSIITNTESEYVIATNEPPIGFSCQNNEACKKVCKQVCVHAEENAIIKAFQRGLRVEGSICLHLKVKESKSAPSGAPSCIYCSRKLLQSGVKYMYLFHEDGWKRYTTEDFHRETLKTLGINK